VGKQVKCTYELTRLFVILLRIKKHSSFTWMVKRFGQTTKLTLCNNFYLLDILKSYTQNIKYDAYSWTKILRLWSYNSNAACSN